MNKSLALKTSFGSTKVGGYRLRIRDDLHEFVSANKTNHHMEHFAVRRQSNKVQNLKEKADQNSKSIPITQ